MRSAEVLIAQGIVYDTQRTTISNLQVPLYQLSDQIEVISPSENMQINAWTDTHASPLSVYR